MMKIQSENSVGWRSWNLFGADVNQQLIQTQVRSIIFYNIEWHDFPIRWMALPLVQEMSMVYQLH